MATKDLENGSRSDLCQADAAAAKSADENYFLEVPLEAIESIRFGALMDQDHRVKVLETMRVREKLQVAKIQMHLSVNRFELDEEILQD